MRTSWAAGVGVTVVLVAACAGGGPSATTGSQGSGRPAPTMTTSATQTSPATSGTSRTTPSPTRTTPGPTRTTTPPSNPTLPRALRDGVVTRIPTTAHVVALTFDGGAGSQGAASVLATLRTTGVPASFFLTGRFATANPAVARQMAAIGPVGNHTWSHPDLTALSAAAVDRELSRARSAILVATGRESRPLFRFPYGAYDSRVLGLVHSAGYGGVGWTTDSLGWKGTSGGMTVDEVVARVLAGRTPGQIILMHVGANPDDGTTLDASALPRVIAGFRSHGYGFTTLGDLLE